MQARRFWFALLAITAVALAVRVTFTVVADPHVPRISDAGAYHLLAENLADGRGYIRPYDLSEEHVVRPTAEYPPLFPAVVAVAAEAGVHGVRGQRLWMCVIGSAAVLLTGLAGRRVAGAAVGLAGAGIVAIHPLVFQSDATLMPETLAVLLSAATLLLAYRALDRPTVWAFVALGGVIGLATLARAEFALLVVLLALPLAWKARSGVAAVAVVAAALAVVAPWTIRNAVRLDAFVPVSNNIGSALDGANCAATYRGTSIGLWLYSPACFDGFSQAELAADGEAAAAARHRDEGIRYARHHAGRLPAVAAVRVLRTWGVWNPAQQTRVATFEGRKLWWERAGTALHWVLTVLAAAGTVVLVRRRRWVWPLLAVIVGVVVTSALTYGNQRFRAGAEPALAILAAVAVCSRFGPLESDPS
jgi:4-amino-4-deoxy-L-arabinose transferase-like glycosyltransferase